MPEYLKFNVPEVEAMFESEHVSNPTVHLPCGIVPRTGWKGKLADIPLAQAERWVNRPNQNLLRRKEIVGAKKKTEQASQ